MELTESIITYIDNELFHRSNAEDEINKLPKPKPIDNSWYFKVVSGKKINESLLVRSELSQEEERGLFLRLNYNYYQLSLEINPDKRRTIRKNIKEIEECIVGCNLALVISFAKRFLKSGLDFSEMLSNGNETVMRAMRKFDISIGNKFSTYIVNSLRMTFIKMLKDKSKENKLQIVYCDNNKELNIAKDENDEDKKIEMLDKMKEAISKNLAALKTEELKALKFRYLEQKENGEKLTYQDIAKIMNYSRENIRLLEVKALTKLKTFLTKSL
jgi:RNA polymerase primary sigma factor/RNA polymerase sigma factor